ncbi:MAG: hypothetical protein ACQPRJ_04490 [Solitalea-like symbiont of Acarus siro]
MEIKLEVLVEMDNHTKPIKTNEAYYSFVAVNEDMQPIEVIPVIPETDKEKYEYEKALERRNMRLSLLKSKK